MPKPAKSIAPNCSHQSLSTYPSQPTFPSLHRPAVPAAGRSQQSVAAFVKLWFEAVAFVALHSINRSMLATVMPVQNGQANGVWETFYPDSSPKTRVGFLNGVLHGIDEEFTKEGKPLRHAINENGKRSGVSTFREYGGKEKLLKKYSKKDGVLHGEYKEFSSDNRNRLK